MISTAVDASAVARVVGIKTEYKNLGGNGLFYLPQRVVIMGQGNNGVTYATDKQQITSAGQAGELYGYGSPIHLAALQLLPINGDGVGSIPVTVYPLEAGESAIASTGTITPTVAATETATYYVYVNGFRSNAIVITSDSTVETVCTDMAAAINAIVEIPATAVATATEVTLTSKWLGSSANGITMRVAGSTTSGNSFAVVQPTGGSVNPDVQDALDLMGEVWETMIVNCLNADDPTVLGTFSTFNEGRWGPLTKKPLVVFSSSVETDLTDATTVPDGRPTDRTNVQLMAPGSESFPAAVTAGFVAKIVKLANNNPPHDYGYQQVKYIDAGPDADQWTYQDKDAAVKKGCSTSDVRDSVVTISDTVTMYHPSGDPLPAYRYVVDVVKLQNIIFNLNLIFDSSEWQGAPLIPDDQPTTNPSAKKPKTAKAVIASMVDSLGNEAIISDPEYSKENCVVAINSSNPKRLDISLPIKLSGNVNIVSIDLNFGFYFDEQPLV